MAHEGRRWTVTVDNALGAKPHKRREQNVLIVEDEAHTRRLLRTIVERLSLPCQISEAGDGDSALELARRRRPDLALLDIVLPESSTSGVMVCHELCKDARTKVVIISGQAEDSIIEACLAMGAVEYVSKPFCAEEMQANIEEWLTN
jgi:CheY-like chemotaxis protein